MINVYGGCAKPEGWDLADEHTAEPCPTGCAPAYHRVVERCEDGCINTYPA